MNKASIENYWNKFLATLPLQVPLHNKSYAAESFGDTPRMADKLGQLAIMGIKTATCSALWEWEVEGRPIPVPGQLTIVLDGRGDPMCIIETTEVFACRFNAVDEEFAYEEGEGDRSLQYWQEAHREFFTRTLPKIGKEFNEDMPLVCERFKVIYR
jgi:uncharacterized protein YhfF